MTKFLNAEQLYKDGYHLQRTVQGHDCMSVESKSVLDVDIVVDIELPHNDYIYCPYCGKKLGGNNNED